MTFNNIADGQPGLATPAMQNWRHAGRLAFSSFYPMNASGAYAVQDLGETGKEWGNLNMAAGKQIIIGGVPLSISGGGGGLEAVALKNALEKQGISYPIPNGKYINNSFSVNDTVSFDTWIRQVYDASVDTTTIYMDHGREGQLEDLDTMDATTGWTSGAGTPTISLDTTNYLGGTGSVKAAFTCLNGSGDMYKAFSVGFWNRLPRISVYPDTLSNVVSLDITLENDASNYAVFSFPVAQLTAADFNHLTCDIDDSAAYTVTGTFNRESITNIRVGVTTSAAQTINLSWDVFRAVSSDSLISTDYSLELVIQDDTNQEIISFLSEDTTNNTTKGKFTMSAALTNDYPDGLNKIDLDQVYASTMSGTIENQYMTHKAGASGQNAKTAKNVRTLYLPKTVSTADVETYIRYYDQNFPVTEFPDVNTIKVETPSDVSGNFKTGDYVFLYKQKQVGDQHISYEGTYTENYLRILLNADATYSSGIMTLTTSQTVSMGSDITGYQVVRDSGKLQYIAGSKTKTAITTPTITEFLAKDNGMPLPEGCRGYFDFSNPNLLGQNKGSGENWSTIGSPGYGAWQNGNYIDDLMSPNPGPGKFLKYVDVNDYMCPIGTGNTDMVLEAWVMFGPAPSGYQSIWMPSTTQNDNPGLFFDTNSYFIWGLGVSGYQDYITPANFNSMGLYGDGKWHHIFCVWDAALSVHSKRLTMWIDGVRPTTTGTSTNATSSWNVTRPSQSMFIGTINDGTTSNVQFDGKIGEIMMTLNCGYIPNQSEIIERYNNGLHRRYGTDYGFTVKTKEESVANIDKMVAIATEDRANTDSRAGVNEYGLVIL